MTHPQQSGPDNKLSGPPKRLMNMDTEKEPRGRRENHNRSRRRTVIIGRRGTNVTGRRGHPVGVGAILDVGELVGASRDRCGEKQYEGGDEAKVTHIHHPIRRSPRRFGSIFLGRGKCYGIAENA